MNKLYRVEVVHVVFVMAEDRRDAEILGERSLRDECPAETFATLIETPEQVDKDWHYALPYGGPEKKTCLEILMDTPGGEPAPKPEDPDQKKLFG